MHPVVWTNSGSWLSQVSAAHGPGHQKFCLQSVPLFFFQLILFSCKKPCRYAGETLCYFKERCSVIIEEVSFWGAAFSIGCWRGHPGPLQSPCVMIRKVPLYKLQSKYGGSRLKGISLPCEPKSPSFFLQCQGSFAYLNTLGQHLIFLESALLLLPLWSGIRHWPFSHGRFTTLSRMPAGMGVPWLWLLSFLCDTFTDSLPFSPVADMKLHVNPVTPWQKHWQFLPAN